MGEVKEKGDRIGELEEGLRHARMEQDRIITRMERDHAEEIERVVAQSNANTASVPQEADVVVAQKQEELDAVNKDLYYYKQSYRELKRKLKKIQRAVKDDVEHKQQECEALKVENAKL